MPALNRRPHAPAAVLPEGFEAAALNAQRAAVLVGELLEDFPERAHLAQDVLACEHEGDRITHAILAAVARQEDGGELTAGEAHALASGLDDVVDFVEEAADRLVIYGVEAPMARAQDLATVLIEATGEVRHALATLNAGDAAGLAGHLERIHRLENDGDRIVRDATASLFVAGIDPMIVIRWKDIFESLEQATDACERVAHALEGVSLRRGR